jgi:hypothetical protein
MAPVEWPGTSTPSNGRRMARRMAPVEWPGTSTGGDRIARHLDGAPRRPAPRRPGIESPGTSTGTSTDGLTAMGRAAGSLLDAKHNIKRVDRLLGNPKVASELSGVYAATIEMLELGTHPIVLVDWTHLDQTFSALVGAIPVDGRSIPILATVHRDAKAGNSRAERAWLDALAKVLPAGTRPILVTDAGYKSPWVREVTRRGWHFVTRLSGHVTFVEQPKQPRQRVGSLYTRAGAELTDFGACQVTKKVKFPQRIVMAPQFRRNPNSKSTPRRYEQRGRSHKQTRVRAQQPWVWGSMSPAPRRGAAPRRGTSTGGAPRRHLDGHLDGAPRRAPRRQGTSRAPRRGAPRRRLRKRPPSATAQSTACLHQRRGGARARRRHA